MATIFDKWNKAIDVEGLQKDIAEADKGNTGDYPDIPAGKYEVKVEKMEIRECGSAKHSGEPMFCVQFRILQGEFEKSCVFWNQLISEGWQISIVKKFLNSLDTGMTIEFTDYGQFNELIMDCMEVMDEKLEYLLDYGQNKKGFNTFKIEEVYEV